MHELSIAKALVEQIEKVVADERARRATRVLIRVGALSGAEPEALRTAFPLAAEGTVAAGAELVIERVEARVLCRACGREAVTDGFFFVCEACGSSDVELVSGRELHLQSADIEVEERQVADV